MLIIANNNIFIKDGEGVQFLEEYSGDFKEKYPNILKDLELPFNIKENFTNIKTDQAEIIFNKGKIQIKVKKGTEINIINIEKKNNTYITTNQQFICTDTNLQDLLKVLLKGYTIV